MNILRVLNEATPLLLKGIGVTVEAMLISTVIALFLGLISCLMQISRSRILKAVSGFYVWLFRGTPMIVQAFFIYFSIPQLIQWMGVDFRLSPFSASLITLSLNAGAYLSEIFRGGVQAIDPGQMEAALSLGLTRHRAMIKIILPQAIYISIPAMVNQFIITLKDTSILSVISLSDIVYQAKIYVGRTMESFATWTVVGIFYLVVITILTRFSKYAERKIKYGNKN